MANILVVAPHPDDETLGCGATILKHLAAGDDVHWLLVSRMDVSQGYSETQIIERDRVISSVAQCYQFSSVIQLNFIAGQLEQYRTADLVAEFKLKLDLIQPDTLYLPYKYDVHTDHAVVFDAMVSASKSFRCSYLKRWLAYETLSETEFSLNPANVSFNPNLFIDVSEFGQKKLEICKLYQSEFAMHPFPRSLQAVESQMLLRGAQASCSAAEAFMVLKEIR